MMLSNVAFVLKARIASAFLLLLLLVPGTARSAEPAEQPRFVIIKVDDMKERTPGWDRLIEIARENGIKVSIGIICNSLQSKQDDYYEWLRELQNSGMVEFWNHGWNHGQSATKEGEKIQEFHGSGYERQKESVAKSQAKSEEVLGVPLQVIGTPFNSMDDDTVRVLNETPELRGVFCYAKNPFLPGLQNKILLPMNLIGERSTGRPDFAKFKSIYDSKKSSIHVTAIQFHPAHYDEARFKEFQAILDLLKADGWKFVLPKEYMELKTSEEKTSSH